MWPDLTLAVPVSTPRRMKAILPPAFLACALGAAACGQMHEGDGVITLAHRDNTCPLHVVLNGDTEFTVHPGTTVERKVRAGGHELRFTSDEGCYVYTNHAYSPFDSGRPLCNVVVEDGADVRFVTRGRYRGTHREVNVQCPE